MSKEKNRASKSVHAIISIFKALFLLVLLLIFAGGTILGCYVLSVLKAAPVIDPSTYRDGILETSKIYDSSGGLLETLVSNEFSEYVTADEIPKYLKDAVVSIEDERFYQHSGVDYRSVARALVEDIKTRSFKEGASTITMQLSKNLYTVANKSIPRKLQDVYYAYNIEEVLTKDQILEAYLNSSGFSKGTVGVQAAAKTFFNKDVKDLTLAECALLAGVTNHPEKYTPYNTHPIEPGDDLTQVELVLLPKQSNSEPNSEEILAIGDTLQELGLINLFDNYQIKQNQIVPVKAIFNTTSLERQHSVLDKMLKQGLITKDEYDQAIAQPIVLDLGKRKAEGISSFYVDSVKKEASEILEALGVKGEALHNKLYNGGLQIHTVMDITVQRSLEETINNIKLPGDKLNDNGVLQPQLGSVILDAHTGAVRGLIGGRGIGGNANLNRATTPRQPGSSIKPISVYVTAFNNGATAGDVYMDAPTKNVKELDKDFTNNLGKYRGFTTIHNLVRYSSNVGAYLVARDISANLDLKQNKNSTYSKIVDNDVSIRKIVETMEKQGITSIVSPEDNPKYNDYDYAPLALGGMTRGISPLEMAGAYTTLSNGGQFVKPFFVDRIETSTGEVIYQHNVNPVEVTSPQNAYILTTLLQDVVKNGTGRNANISGVKIAGKTGTTNSKKEAWFVGYSPYYVCSVFIGDDLHQRLKFDSTQAASTFAKIMKPLHENLEEKDFEEPDGLYKKRVNGITDFYVEGTKPRNTHKLSWGQYDDKKETKDKKAENKNTKNSNKGESRTKSVTNGETQSKRSRDDDNNR